MRGGGWRVRGIGTTIHIRRADPLDNERTGRNALDSFLFRLNRRTPDIQFLARQILSAIGVTNQIPSSWPEEFRRAARRGDLVFEEIPNTRASIGLFMEGSSFKLAIRIIETKDGVTTTTLQRNPFGIFDNDQQTLFEFDYQGDTFKAGDDRNLISAGELEP